MPLESDVDFLGDLDPNSPGPAEFKSEGDDHFRNLKKALRQSFPGATGPILVMGTATGPADAYVLTPARPLVEYRAGMLVAFQITAANATTAPTLNISSLGAKTIKAVDGAALVAGDMPVNSYQFLLYNGTDFVQQAPSKAYVDRVVKALKDYTDQLAFSSNFPGQAGNAGKVIYTDGENVYWGLPIAAQAGNAGRVLSTDGADSFWTDYADKQITSAGAIGPGSFLIMGNYSITTPDLTTAKPLALTTASNASAVPATITTADGWTVATGFVAGASRTIAPTAYGAPHGIWGSALLTPPVNGTATVAGAGNTPRMLGSAALSASLVVMAATDSNNNIYLAAANPTSGNIGAAATVTVGSALLNLGVYASSATSFVVFYSYLNNVYAVGGTVGGVSISLGTPVLISGALLNDLPAQLSPSLFVCSVGAGLTPVQVSGATVTVGTYLDNVTSVSGSQRIAALGATTVLVASPSTTTTSALRALVATINFPTVSLGTAVTSANANNRVGNLVPNNVLIPFGAGVFLYGAIDQTTATTSNWNVISVSGTTVTIGAGVSQTSTPITSQDPTFPTATYLTTSMTRRVGVALDANRILLVLDGVVAVASRSGTTLTFGTPVFTGMTNQTLLADVGTGALMYVATVSGTSAQPYKKITVSGTVPTIAYTIIGTPRSIFSDTLTDVAVNYGGTWYSWNVPAASLPLSATKYASLSAWPAINIYGSFT